MGTSPSSSGSSSSELAAASLTAVVFAGGDPPPPHALDGVPVGAFVVAADSGIEHAVAAGLHVDLLVGDLDSAAPARVAEVISTGTEVERHPPDKDATDLELALDAVAGRGIGDVVVVGIHGGRADHLLANALLLASPRYAGMRVRGHLGDSEVVTVRDRVDLPGPVGRLCTLLPVGGPATGVVTTGLRYPLAQETLAPGSTRGVSNVVEQAPATVSLRTGVLLAILPDLPTRPSTLQES
jgi:thiamine pyrophosphokinase